MADRSGSSALFVSVGSSSGKPSAAVVREAARWMARLQVEAGPDTFGACEKWRAAHPDHECAWQRIQALSGAFSNTAAAADPRAARTALEVAPGATRRKLIKLSLVFAGVAVLGHRAAETIAPTLLAAHRTGVGERLTLTAADGSRLVLNTSTAIDVEISEARREIWLRRGEILVETAPDPANRPFIVHTVGGRLQPLGTRFTVRQYDDSADRVRVAVMEGAVRVRPGKAAGGEATVHAGHYARFSPVGVEAPRPINDPATEGAWQQGMLIAERMPLARFAAELARYRPGLVRCEPAVATLTVTGAFPLDDTDGALRMLEEVLPVRIMYRTRYWITMGPA